MPAVADSHKALRATYKVSRAINKAQRPMWSCGRRLDRGDSGNPAARTLQVGIMFTAPEHRPIVTMLADGSPVWYVAAVTKSDRHHVYAVGARYGYPNRATLKRALEELTAVAAARPAA